MAVGEDSEVKVEGVLGSRKRVWKRVVILGGVGMPMSSSNFVLVERRGRQVTPEIPVPSFPETKSRHGHPQLLLPAASKLAVSSRGSTMRTCPLSTGSCCSTTSTSRVTMQSSSGWGEVCGDPVPQRRGRVNSGGFLVGIGGGGGVL